MKLILDTVMAEDTKNVNADIKLKSGKNAILTIYTDDMSVTETGNKVDDALNRPN